MDRLLLASALVFLLVSVAYLVYRKSVSGLVFVVSFLFLGLVSAGFALYNGEQIITVSALFSFFAIAGALPSVLSAAWTLVRVLSRKNKPALVFVSCVGVLTAIAYYLSGNPLMSLAYSVIPSAVIGWLMSSGNAISVNELEEQQAEVQRKMNDPKYAYLFDEDEREKMCYPGANGNWFWWTDKD
jgi:phosphoglycerol transferase MdoB-like AlkP superfamily enzyme